MNENFSGLSGQDALQAENDFLKMKMMLEHGASFSKVSEDCSPEVENEFLNYIMEFEKQAEHPTYIRIFDKIGQPAHFKNVNDIPEAEMEKALEDLMDYLEQHQISVGVCSPNISDREVYRFITEELFLEEMSDINIPGMMHGFIYDEFHPDVLYENTNAAVEYCIAQILKEGVIKWTPQLRHDNLRLNNHYPLTEASFKEIINQFKSDITIVHNYDISQVECMVDEDESFVKGHYHWDIKVGEEPRNYSGNWIVNLQREKDFDYWYIISVTLEGIEF